ncbi:MAG: histidine kinase [Pseudomonadota bacterium]
MLKTVLSHLAFWAAVFLLNVGPDWHRYASPREVIEVGGTITALQALVAIIAVRYLKPRWLDRGAVKTFAALLLGVLFIAAEVNILISYFYLEPTYAASYAQKYVAISDLNLIERLGFSLVIRWIVFSKIPLLCFPAAVLIAVAYYRKEQREASSREQRKAAEIEALKNQLNPHFIFNTLNNIYALAIQRSPQTAEAVAKLSGILDYVLYRCGNDYVSLGEEVAMLEDYMALERLRFGDRVEVSFSNDSAGNEPVAPLLFLTLIENAFKHGVSQALGDAAVDVALRSDDREIVLEVSNTRPAPANDDDAQRSGIGLANLRRQLGLLYPDAHRLDLVDSAERFTATLALDRLAA